MKKCQDLKTSASLVTLEERYGFRHGFQHTNFSDICNVSTFTRTDTP